MLGPPGTYTQVMMVDWPAAELTAYSAAMRPDKAVVLGYDGCHLHILSQCHGAGGYSYTPTGGRQDSVHMRSAAELNARLNFWGPAFEAQFAKTNELDLDLFLNGEYRAKRTVFRGELEGSCEYATHTVTAVQVGASILHSGSATLGGASVGYGPVGGSGNASSSIITLARSCPNAQTPFACADPVRAEIVAIGDRSKVSCPPGMVFDENDRCTLPMDKRTFGLTVGRVAGEECRFLGGCEYHLYLRNLGDLSAPIIGERTGASYSAIFDFNWKLARPFAADELARGLDLSIWHDGSFGAKKMGTCSITATVEELRALEVGKSLDRNMTCADNRTLTFQFVREH